MLELSVIVARPTEDDGEFEVVTAVICYTIDGRVILPDDQD